MDTKLTTQFKLLAGVRWMALRNSLRKKHKRFELFFQIVLWVLGALLVGGIGLGVFFGVYFGLRKSTAVIAIVFWAVFVVWQLFPLVIEGQSPALNFRELARYPLRFPVFYLMSVAYGLLDPAALTALFWLFCAWLAVVLARPELWLRVTVACVLMAMVNLLLNRVLFGWLERIFQTRKGRERSMVGLMLLGVAWQVFFFSGMSEESRGSDRMRGFFWAVNSVSPPGMAFVLVQKGWEMGATPALALAAICGALLFLLHRQLWRNFTGEYQSEGARRTGAVQAQPGWEIAGMGESGSAIVEKELRHVLKDPKILLNLISVWAFCALVAFGSGFLKRAFHIESINAPYLYPSLVGYTFLVLSAMMFNIFWSDTRGFSRWLLAPVTLRQVVAGKNIATAVLVVVNFLMVTLIVRLGREIPLRQFAQVVAGLAYVTLAMMAAGNVLSVWFPRRVDADKLSSKNVSEAAILFSMLTQLALGTSWFAVVFFAARWGLSWFPAVAFAGLFAIAVILYRMTLERVPKYIGKNLEKFNAELG